MKRSAFITALAGLYALASNPEAYKPKREELSKAVADSAEMTDEEKVLSQRELVRADAEVNIAGYNGGRPSPTVDNGQAHQADSPGNLNSVTQQETPTGTVSTSAPHADGLTPEQREAVKAILDREETERQNSAYGAAIDSELDTAIKSNETLAALRPDIRASVLRQVQRMKPSADSLPQVVADAIQDYAKLVADGRLAKVGVNNAQGRTVAVVTNENPTWMEPVDKLVGAMDDYSQRVGAEETPQAVRDWNRKNIIDPLLKEQAQRRGHGDMNAMFAAEDALYKGGERALADSLTAAGDNTSVSVLFNQPTISTALLIQSFQTMRALQFVGVMGPGMDEGAGGWAAFPGDGSGIGSVLRIPVELYSSPSGQVMSRDFDPGLISGENSPIPMGGVETHWLPFAPTWRRIGTALTSEAVKAIGNGPLNYPLLARSLYGIARDKSRRIDKALFDNMLQTSDEYQAVSVSAESVNLTNNSKAGAGLTINLNPAKTAAAAVASGDLSATYASDVVAAIRLACGSAGSAAPFVGTSATAALGAPIVRPRTVTDLTSAGQLTTSTVFPFTIAGQVRGYLDDNRSIQNIGNTTATYAVDFENGVVVFNAAAGLSASSGLITTATTIAAYSYARNYADFLASTLTLTGGVTVEEQMNALIALVDTQAAIMGSAPRFSAPNLVLGSLLAMSNVTRATIFAPLMAPRGTELFPMPDVVAQRNGVNFARHNTPWQGGDRRLLLGQRGATKYGIDTPFEIQGPFPMYDPVTAQPIAKKAWWGQENSVIATPQVTDKNGNVLNPKYRTIRVI